MARPDAKTVPIIAMTANAFAEDVQTALDNGMNAHIAKPINVRIVMETLAKFIHGQAAGLQPGAGAGNGHEP
jgi:CheY-like chemotaxis protein